MRRVVIALAFLLGLGACVDTTAPPPPCVIMDVAAGVTTYHDPCPVAPR